MQKFMPCALAVLALGCSGPSVGDVLTLDGGTVFLDPEVFRTAVQLAEAGSNRTGLDPLKDAMEGRPLKYTALGHGSRVRVIERVTGGVKIVIEKGTGLGAYDAGKVGWMQAKDLELWRRK